MSSQSSNTPSIAFSLTAPPQSFRLLELPDELLQLIANHDGTTSPPSLRLTSAPALQGLDGEVARGTPRQARGREQLHLCTEDKVWAVRQVSTSNCVYITRTTGREGHDGGENRDREGEMDLDAVAAAAASGMTAIAQVGGVLELLPVEMRVEEVEERVAELVPLNEGPVPSWDNSRGLDEVHGDVPAPTMLLREAMDRLCVVEIGRQAYQPSKRILLQVWRKMVEGCAIGGIRLDGAFEWRKVVEAMLLDEDEDMYGAGSASAISTPGENDYKAIAEALLSRAFPRSHLVQQQSQASSALPETISLHPRNTTGWLGALLLMADTTGKGFQQSAFVDTWHQLVPEQWWSFCVTSNIGECSVRPAGEPRGDWIEWKGGDPTRASVRNDIADGQGSSMRPASSAAAKMKMGKWHAKFAAQRGTKT